MLRGVEALTWETFVISSILFHSMPFAITAIIQGGVEAAIEDFPFNKSFKHHKAYQSAQCQNLSMKLPPLVAVIRYRYQMPGQQSYDIILSEISESFH